MCGIAGYLDERGRTGAARLGEVGSAMAAQLAHRGPDDRGVWCDEAAGVVLAHTRLAILDLSQDGAQPMHSANRRYVISYNGEVYNHPEMRRDLEGRGRAFRGRSDTEVLVEAISEWGVEETLRRVNGMFAFALYDRHERRLFLARDRLGEKPLYYGWFGGALLFASELKALRAHPAFSARIDRGALALYMRYGYVPYPYAIYESVSKLPPGTFLEVSEGEERPAPRRYWSADDVSARGLAEPFTGNETRAVDELQALLRDAVRIRMASDVPLGAFLSGGIDSSTVVALMQAQSNRPIETFAIGFDDPAIDEAEHAKAVARHLGTNHHELYVTGRDALDLVPRIPTIYDEPFADPSQIPTCLLARFTKTRVTVSLSGDGGDELFCGYDRYAHALSMWRRLNRVPTVAREALARLALDFGSVPLLARALRRAPASIRHRAEIGGHFAGAHDFRALYRILVSRWREHVVLGVEEPRTPFSRAGDAWPVAPLEQAMLLDLLTYLPEDILTKVDRACMAVSLESRVPLLDHRVVEYAWRLPIRLKLRGTTTKWILRRVLDRYVPRRLVERPKRGFTAPIGGWIRGALRPWAMELLSGDRLRHEGFLESEIVATKLHEHVSGERDWGWPLWSALVFEAWRAEQREGSADVDRPGSARAAGPRGTVL